MALGLLVLLRSSIFGFQLLDLVLGRGHGCLSGLLRLERCSLGACLQLSGVEGLAAAMASSFAIAELVLLISYRLSRVWRRLKQKRKMRVLASRKTLGIPAHGAFAALAQRIRAQRRPGFERVASGTIRASP